MGSGTNSDTRLEALEQKYIELLERRVTELETRLAQAGTVASKTGPGEKKDDSGASSVEDGPAESVSAGEKESKKQPAKDKEEKTGKEDDEEQDEFGDDRYLVVLNSLDAELGEFKDRRADSAPIKAPKTDNKAPTRAFILRKFMRTQTIRGEDILTTKRSEVEVVSPPLQKLLGHVMHKYEGTAKVTQMSSPYVNLVWSWETAEAEAEADENKITDPDASEEDKQAREDLRALLGMIATSSGDESLDRYFKTRQSMKDTRTVNFESLWTLFPKGSFIVSRPFFDQTQVFMVQSCIVPDMTDTEPELIVIAYSYDWDGFKFNRVPYRFEVPSFPDKKTLGELRFYPLSEHEHLRSSMSGEGKRGGALKDSKQDLIDRGRDFYKYCVTTKGKQTFQYNGPAYAGPGAGGLFGNLDDDSDSMSIFPSSSRIGLASMQSINETADDSDNRPSNKLEGPVVIDFRSYYEFNPSAGPSLGDQQSYARRLSECRCDECKTNFEAIYRYSWDGKTGKPPRDSELADDQYMMLPPRLLGYSLKRKRWFQVLVKCVKRPDAGSRTNFDTKLRLADKDKDLIRDSVKAHGKENIVDYIPDKGKGLVILLWGAPGIGKTLTAESVADLAGKPLFSIGVSDIGTKSKMVEANLERIFALAGRWEAVLLLDEADVFLEARDARGADMERNSMVSVLLRILEYYDGILILTTNRLKTFDIAVRSRIHIAIQYKELSDQDRTDIFKDFLQQLQSKQEADPGAPLLNWDSCMEWVTGEGCSKSLNGRQIRNIVFTAMNLAHSETEAKGRNVLLDKSHLTRITRNAESFAAAVLETEAVYRNNQLRSGGG
ncbi:aaa family ATPase [Cercophora scortea]|uniref:Aaa family ATPase n=1 Tax=Cercophora scortea TaxID=314031 RepID=A0AAE0IAI7_9PEZI|nr:aaa family ATPase [Cercophora scortea]